MSNSLTSILINSGLFFAILSLVYLLVHRRSNLFQLNRWVLLWLPPMAFLLSMMPNFLQHIELANFILPEQPLVARGSAAADAASWWIQPLNWYLLTCLLVLLFRSFKAYQGFQNLKKQEGYAFSFLGRKYIDSKYSGVERELIDLHESAHIDQKHHWDLLFAEMVLILFWPLPTTHIWYKQLKLQHEFLADQACKTHGLAYKKLLAEQALGVKLDLSHTFSIKSQLKTRLDMISNSTTKRKAALVAWLPVILCCFMFTQSAQAQEKLKPFTEVDQAAEYVNGGFAGLSADLTEGFKYPSESEKAGVEGKVMVQLIIGKDGNIVETKVVKGVNAELDKYALSMVSKLGKFKPAMDEGKPVKVSLTLPISFKLSDK